MHWPIYARWFFASALWAGMALWWAMSGAQMVALGWLAIAALNVIIGVRAYLRKTPNA